MKNSNIDDQTKCIYCGKVGSYSDGMGGKDGYRHYSCQEKATRKSTEQLSDVMAEFHGYESTKEKKKFKKFFLNLFSK